MVDGFGEGTSRIIPFRVSSGEEVSLEMSSSENSGRDVIVTTARHGQYFVHLTLKCIARTSSL